MKKESDWQIVKKLLGNSTLWIAALGYFVDLFDLVLFGIVRIPSLKSLGLSETEIFVEGAYLLNWQMGGLLIGGLFWGLLADRYGRLNILFASIIFYSGANFLNAFVATIPQYAALRFIAGIGLAGELGVAVTLISESVPKNYRGYASAFIAFAGFLGAIVAATTSSWVDWKTAYMIGGVLGILLLFARVRSRESPLFQKEQKTWHHGERLKALFCHRQRFVRFLNVTLTGFPIWFTAGVMIYFSPELARETGVAGPIVAGSSILISYIGSLLGDIFAGFLSQRLESRKKVIAGGLVLMGVFSAISLFATRGWSTESYYVLMFFLGVANGYWALFVTFATEQFGTNLRATVTTSVPNLVRAVVIPLSICIQFLRESLGFIPAVAVVGLTTLTISFFTLWKIEESFQRDLDFVED